MVIVGAGEAGARAAVTLREAGYEGPLALIGDEPHLPYERPPLSKAAMTGALDPTPTHALDEARCRDLAIGHIHARAAAIDRLTHQLRLEDGRTLSYDRLLLATGAAARRLNVPGAEHALYLRTFADALALRQRLRPGKKLAVIGGGFIGLEVTASAVERGCGVTLIEAAPRLLSRAVPAEIAALVEARHRRAGVSIHLGVGVARISADGSGFAVLLADGASIPCDGVIAGIGAVPETTLAETAGLPINNGVAVSETLQTPDPDIFAAGDCCSFPHALYGGRRIRLEAWRNAQDQGAAAARAMLGSTEPYAQVPWFWSDQYDETLQIAGLPDEGAATVQRKGGDGGVFFFHLAADGRLVAASAVGPNARIARDIKIAELLIAARAMPDPTALAAPGVKLRSLLKG